MEQMNTVAKGTKQPNADCGVEQDLPVPRAIPLLQPRRPREPHRARGLELVVLLRPLGLYLNRDPHAVADNGTVEWSSTSSSPPWRRCS